MCVERSLALDNAANMSMILPLSLISTRRMASLQQFLSRRGWKLAGILRLLQLNLSSGAVSTTCSKTKHGTHRSVLRRRRSISRGVSGTAMWKSLPRLAAAASMEGAGGPVQVSSLGKTPQDDGCRCRRASTEPVPTTPVRIDPDWIEQIALAKQAYQDGKKLRKGKPILFRTSGPLRLGDDPYA